MKSFRSFVIAAAALIIAVPAFGQAKSPSITVADAISIWNGIQALDNHSTGVLDKNGNQVTAPNNFQYSGAVHLALARDGAKAYMVVKEYNDELAKLRTKFTEDRKKLVDEIGDDKTDAAKKKLADFDQDGQKQYDKQSAEMLAAPVSDVAFIHIKSADLCLDAKPPECPVRNAIPINILTALLPIIDDK